jgi:hypothetical protein
MIEASQSYRPAFIWLFLAVFAAGAVSGALVSLVLQGFGYTLPGVISYTFLRLLCIIYLWAAAATLLLMWTFTVCVTSEGLHGRTFWGTTRFVPWDDVLVVRLAGMPPFRFLRVFSADGGAALWAPLFMKRRADFIAELRHRAGPANPVVEVLK